MLFSSIFVFYTCTYCFNVLHCKYEQNTWKEQIEPFPSKSYGSTRLTSMYLDRR